MTIRVVVAFTQFHAWAVFAFVQFHAVTTPFLKLFQALLTACFVPSQAELIPFLKPFQALEQAFLNEFHIPGLFPEDWDLVTRDSLTGVGPGLTWSKWSFTWGTLKLPPPA